MPIWPYTGPKTKGATKHARHNMLTEYQSVISLSVILFVFLAYTVSRRIAIHIYRDAKQRLNLSESKYKKLERRKEKFFNKKLNLEDETIHIFTLYEITKEITKYLKRSNAIKKFKEKLSEHVHYDECLFLEVLSPQYEKIKNSKDYYIFTLKHKRKKIGYLALKGIKEDDYETVNVLGSQFALALRRVELYQELEKIAITDSLTEVNTRRHSLERLAEELNRSQARKIKLSFLMIDVDHFKKYNDQYGHLTGDQILREIGNIIKDNIREIDIAGRYGGEEFCVILPDTDLNGAQLAAERIRHAAEEAIIKVYDEEVKITLSLGISTYPDHARNVDELIDKADWALYRAKKMGRNKVCTFGDYPEES